MNCYAQKMVNVLLELLLIENLRFFVDKVAPVSVLVQVVNVSAFNGTVVLITESIVPVSGLVQVVDLSFVNGKVVEIIDKVILTPAHAVPTSDLVGVANLFDFTNKAACISGVLVVVFNWGATLFITCSVVVYASCYFL